MNREKNEYDDVEDDFRDGLLEAGYSGADMNEAMEDIRRRWEKED